MKAVRGCVRGGLIELAVVLQRRATREAEQANE
jgi:hypothetical protein